MADLTSPAATDRILAVLAEALTTLGDIQHDRVIMAAAVLAHQQPHLAPSEVVDITATGLGDERARRAWDEGRRLLSDAVDQAAAREDAEQLVSASTLRPGMVVSHPAWNGGHRVRIVTAHDDCTQVVIHYRDVRVRRPDAVVVVPPDFQVTPGAGFEPHTTPTPSRES